MSSVSLAYRKRRLNFAVSRNIKPNIQVDRDLINNMGHMHISGIEPSSVCVCLFVFYVTCNDISVIYVTAQMCRWTEEEVVPTVGLQMP